MKDIFKITPVLSWLFAQLKDPEFSDTRYAAEATPGAGVQPPTKNFYLYAYVHTMIISTTGAGTGTVTDEFGTTMFRLGAVAGNFPVSPFAYITRGKKLLFTGDVAAGITVSIGYQWIYERRETSTGF